MLSLGKPSTHASLWTDRQVITFFETEEIMLIFSTTVLN